MSHHQDSTKCAGKCAGLVSLKTSSNKKYTKVKDRRGQPIRGLWKRCGTYYARVTVEDPNGIRRDRRFALEASNLSEAKEELARLRAEPPKPNLGKKSVPLFPNFWPSYIEAVRHQKRERTIKSEQMFLRQWESWLGAIALNRISTAHVLGFRTQKLSKGLSGRTVNLAVTVLNNLLNHARDLGLVDSLPTQNLKPIRWKPKRRRLFTTDDINRLCEAALDAGQNGQMLSDYLRLMACCGSRRDETLRLSWGDVDWNRKQLCVGSDGFSKNHEARVVDFNSFLEGHLRAMFNRRDKRSVWLFPAPR